MFSDGSSDSDSSTASGCYDSDSNDSNDLMIVYIIVLDYMVFFVSLSYTLQLFVVIWVNSVHYWMFTRFLLMAYFVSIVLLYYYLQFDNHI